MSFSGTLGRLLSGDRKSEEKQLRELWSDFDSSPRQNDSLALGVEEEKRVSSISLIGKTSSLFRASTEVCGVE
jgi:hypothetical protein